MELVKREDHWALYNEDGHKIAATLSGCYSKLSVKNCEAIVNGYDLDKLADEHCNRLYHEGNINWDRYRIHFKLGFQKALEILGDKKFSEEDIDKAFDSGYEMLVSQKKYNDVLQEFKESLQQTEFDVEIVMDKDCYSSAGRCDKLTMADCIICTPVIYLKDADGCLILKKI